MKSKLHNLVNEHEHYVISCYKHLHANPELSFQEHETSQFIAQELKKMGIKIRENIAGTGILGIIEGKNPSKKTIALRADMDALPIQEETSLPYCSTNQQIMHACGHDSHTACLLGVAAILNQLKGEFEGTYLLIFQPGEEKAPGGARLMMEDGLFDDYEPDMVIAQHVSVDYPTGTLGFMKGKMMASADEIHITINGKGGHGALPHLCNDTVLAAAQTIVSLQQVKSRLCHPLQPMVLTFGKITSGGAQNIIPHQVKLSGTFRAYDENWRLEGKKHIQRIIHETCAAYGCTAEIEMPDGFPSVINHHEITEKAIFFASEWVGNNNIVSLEPRMTSEDFGFFTQKYPSTFFRFGAKGETNKNTGGLHSSNFEIDLDALQTGVGGMCWIAWRMITE